MLTQNFQRVVALEFDPETSKLLLAAALITSDPGSQSAQFGYRVELLSL